MPLGDDVDLWKVAERTELFTGADLEGLEGKSEVRTFCM